MGKAPIQRVCNTDDPKAYMRIQYDGSNSGPVDLHERAETLIEHLEWKMPDTFSYLLYRDEEKTGNFEISLYKDGACAS
jgi:hypothetical protein